MRIYSFEKLETWQRARVFRKEIYEITKRFPKEELFGLTSQIKRSASSIGDCLAEGSGRVTSKDKAHFVTMAYASTLETLNHIIGANDLGYINENEYQTLRSSIYELTNKLNALRRFLLKKS